MESTRRVNYPAWFFTSVLLILITIIYFGMAPKQNFPEIKWAFIGTIGLILYVFTPHYTYCRNRQLAECAYTASQLSFLFGLIALFIGLAKDPAPGSWLMLFGKISCLIVFGAALTGNIFVLPYRIAPQNAHIILNGKVIKPGQEYSINPFFTYSEKLIKPDLVGSITVDYSSRIGEDVRKDWLEVTLTVDPALSFDLAADELDPELFLLETTRVIENYLGYLMEKYDPIMDCAHFRKSLLKPDAEFSVLGNKVRWESSSIREELS